MRSCWAATFPPEARAWAIRNGVTVASIHRNVAGAWTLLGAQSTSGIAGQLRFEVVGTSLKLFFNNTLVVNATDALLRSGSVGVRSTPGATYANFSAGVRAPLTSASLSFNDDFASHNYNGVELGKALAQRIIPELEASSEPELKHDSSTNNLIRRYRQMKGQP